MVDVEQRRWAVAVMGLPGAGKSTVATRLAEILDVPVFSVGNALRTQAAAGDRAAQEIMAAFRAVATPTFASLLKVHVEAGGDVVLLDGSPRTIGQAQVVADLVKPWLPVGICLEIDQATAERRLLDRSLSSGRADDQGEVDGRVGVQAIEFGGVVDYFENRWPLLRVDAKLGTFALIELAVEWLQQQGVRIEAA